MTIRLQFQFTLIVVSRLLTLYMCGVIYLLYLVSFKLTLFSQTYFIALIVYSEFHGNLEITDDVTSALSYIK